MGNEGTIRVMNRQDLYFEPEPTIRGGQRAEPRPRGHQGTRRHPYQRTAGVQGKRRRHQPLPELHPERARQGAADRAAAGRPAGRHQRPHGHALVQEPEEDRLGRSRAKGPLRLMRAASSMAAVATAGQRARLARWIIGRGVDLTLVIGSAAGRLRLPVALHRAARPDLAAVVVLERGLRRHAHLRHRLPHVLRSRSARARSASCSTAACCSSFRWVR